MIDIDTLKWELMSDEGSVKRQNRHMVYKDHLGNDTIGYGRLLSRGLSDAEAEFMLAVDIQDTLDVLDRNIPWWRGLPSLTMRGVANLGFQIGWSRLKGFKKTLAFLEAGLLEEASVEALDSDWARQTPERAKRVAAMLKGK